MSEPNTPQAIRQALLTELSSLTAIARGTLAEEFRVKPAPDGDGSIRLGPYYKHQCWEGGRNHSARVPAHCVAQLREDLHQGERFDQLTAQLAALAIEQGKTQRAALTPETSESSAADSKKNSRKNASRKGISKQKPTSPRSSPSSQKKG